MLNDHDLLALIANLESDRVERTESVKDTDKFSIAICAFSNDFPNNRQPGYVIVGVSDKGVPNGLVVSDKLLLDLAAIRSNGNVLPLPAMTVQK